MECTDRGETPYLKNDLLTNPRRYAFVQAVRLLRFVPEQPNDFADYLNDHLRFKPFLSLGFPATDVTDIEEKQADDRTFFQITTTFLGLYGPASPLPTYYTEDLLDEAQEGKTVKRDFLDIFNTLFTELFYEGWAKYRWYVKLFDEADEHYYARLFCLLGLGQESFREKVPGSRRLLRYIGLFSQFPRSAAGMQALLADACNLPDVRIEQCVTQMAAIPLDQRCRLGIQGHILAEDCYLGREIEDKSSKIRIHAGRLGGDTFHGLLPDTPRFNEIIDLLAIYLLQPLDCELSLQLQENEAGPVQLGAGQWSQLGYNTWLFAGDTFEDAPVVRFKLPVH
ncbi:MAG: type VI secretion system baseplate subunit TssG [Thermodesulfobacteriota bacterium]|nr:type VI secretion system baseplate subunit TssG [Thermodesulfobacteriota bacterium]